MNRIFIRLRLTTKWKKSGVLLTSEINYDNIRIRMTLMKRNVGSLSLASEINEANIRLRMTLKRNIGRLSLAAEVNGASIRLRIKYDAKKKWREFIIYATNE